jgi:uncharacterized membrane protein
VNATGGADRGAGNDEAPQGLTTLLSRALGLLSLGLGVGSLAAPDKTRELTGLDHSIVAPIALRAAGARELLHAAGLLAARNPTGWVWSRVAGDAMDLAVLGRATRHRHRDRRRRAMIATGVVAGITMLDLAVAIGRTRSARARRRAMSLRSSVTVNRPSEEVYRFWHNLGNLPKFMHHLDSVRTDGDGRSHWRTRGPAGSHVEWDAEITEDRPNQLIAWRSLDGTRVPNSGRVQFVPAAGGKGTEVRVELAYAPPAGSLGKAFAKLFGEEPAQQVRDDLRRFKQVIETGEVVRSDGSPEGIHARRELMQRPARPMATG